MNTRPHYLQSTTTLMLQGVETRFWTSLSGHISSSSRQNSQYLWLKMPVLIVHALWTLIKCGTTSIPCSGHPWVPIWTRLSMCGMPFKRPINPLWALYKSWTWPCIKRGTRCSRKHVAILFSWWAGGARQSYRLAEDIHIINAPVTLQWTFSWKLPWAK